MPNGFGRGMGRGWGRGWGRGMGWGRGWGPPPGAYGPMGYEPDAYPYEPTEEELKREIEYLKQEKTAIDGEIAEIEKVMKEKSAKKEKAPRPLDKLGGNQARGKGGK